MTAEEFLKSKEPNTYIFPVEWLEEYAEEVLKIAAEKAKIKRNYYPNNQQLDSQLEQREFNAHEYTYFISQNSILNCLKK